MTIVQNISAKVATFAAVLAVSALSSNAAQASMVGSIQAPSLAIAFIIAPSDVAPSDVAPQPIPTPALLPGLIGMGIAAYRKRRRG